jgi:hypothetical protein
MNQRDNMKKKTLNSLSIPTTGTSKPSSKAPKFVPFKLRGRAVSKFCRAAKCEAAAKKAKEEHKAGFFKKALEVLFRHNLDNPETPMTTVKVSDDGEGIVNVSFKNQYSTVADKDRAVEVLNTVGAENVNDLLVETVKAKFDMSVFANEDGSLNQDLYVEMVEAISKIATKHGKPMPLSSEIVVTTKTDFHARRWFLGSDESDQEDISSAIKNTVSTTPVAK